MINFLKFKKHFTSLDRGMTVMEILVVLAIVGILTAVVLPSFNTMRQMNILKSSTSDVSSALDKARSQTLASLNSSEYGVHFQSGKIVIFKGKIYASNDANNETISMTSSATISTISLTGGAVDLYYNRLTGAPNVSGTVTLGITGNGSLTKTITISITGAVSQN